MEREQTIAITAMILVVGMNSMIYFFGLGGPIVGTTGVLCLGEPAKCNSMKAELGFIDKTDSPWQNAQTIFDRNATQDLINMDQNIATTTQPTTPPQTLAQLVGQFVGGAFNIIDNATGGLLSTTTKSIGAFGTFLKGIVTWFFATTLVGLYYAKILGISPLTYIVYIFLAVFSILQILAVVFTISYIIGVIRGARM